MAGMDRRQALQLAMAAAIAPGLYGGPAFAGVPSRLIDPPQVPMRYSRRVTRNLIDGTPLSVARDFEVSFQRVDGGFMLHGAQASVQVDAPKSLEQFAHIERGRDESDLFPLALDPFGQILSNHVAQPASDELREAVTLAHAALAAQPLSQDERAQLSHFVSALQEAGQRVTAHLPRDLFAPADLSRRDEQGISLPSGLRGTVETVFQCQRDMGTGLMRAASRDVITRVAQSKRRTSESWSLTAI